MAIFQNTLDYFSDPFIQNLLEKYLDKTIAAETIAETFERFINASFITLDQLHLYQAFKETDKNKIDDQRWLNATSKVINDKDYTTFTNVGKKYMKLYATDFVSQNKIIIINDFCKKYCKEKSIRESILNSILSSSELLTKTIGELLGNAYREEMRLRTEEKANANVEFSVYSREAVFYNLPPLTEGKLYFFEIEAGNGVGSISGNVLKYTPPLVLKEAKIYASILVIDKDGIVSSRHSFNILVKPPKYLTPSFDTYKLLPNSTIKVNLPVVEGVYDYKVEVPRGFGEVSVKDFMLYYTAPVSALPQNIGVRLRLVWNGEIEVYSTVINFFVTTDPDNISMGDISNNYEELIKNVNELKAHVQALTDDVYNSIDIDESGLIEE